MALTKMAFATGSSAKAWISFDPIEPKMARSRVGSGLDVSVGGADVTVAGMLVAVGESVAAAGTIVARTAPGCAGLPQLAKMNMTTHNTDLNSFMQPDAVSCIQ